MLIYRRFRRSAWIALAVGLVVVAGISVLAWTVVGRSADPGSCSAGKIALTFDDGPDAHTTPPILSALHDAGAVATFFTVGSRIADHPELVAAEVAGGNAVENHSWDHPHLTGLSPAAVRDEIVSTQDAIIAAGAPAPTLFRFPYGSTNPAVTAQVRGLGLGITGYSIDTNDWRGVPVDQIVRTAVDQARPNAVVLMHDGVRESVNTGQALPRILTGLKARGFCFARATEVPPPGHGAGGD